MILKGVDFGHVFNASGARGFHKEGYWFHKFFPLSYDKCTFISKTTTLRPRAGNMPLSSNNTPRELIPKCIVVKPIEGVVLNSVGLSGPGAASVLFDLEDLKEPFFISFMSVDGSKTGRLEEIKQFVELLHPWIRRRKIGLQINLSCPNVGLDPSTLIDESGQVLDEVKSLNIPIVVKINATVPPKIAKQITEHEVCDAISCSNTIPWGSFPDLIGWTKLFGETSPLEAIGNGGLSGAPLLRIVYEWLLGARHCGIQKPIIGCGGILSQSDADRIIDAGASAIELGSVSILRPWRVQGIINHINKKMAATL